MMQSLHIGIVGGNPGWEQILSQIGVSWSRMDIASAKSPNHYSCIIVNRTLERDERHIIETFIDSGRSVIDTSGQFLPVLPVQRRVSTIHAEADTFLSHIPPIKVVCKCPVYAESALFQGTVWFDPSPVRAVCFVGLPVHRLAEMSPMVSTLFRSSYLPAVQERTSRYSSDPYLEVIFSVLKNLHSKINFPFVHKWWMPDHDRLTATFRIDSDYGTIESIHGVAKTAMRHNVPLTWFLHVSAHESWLRFFSTFPSHEIAIHCFNHNEYETAGQYFSDITRALKYLRSEGYDPRGYAAPYGAWNPQLAEAVSRFPFIYSSEFGYDYDSLPSTPPQSGILQLPVHPISAGSLRRFNYSEDRVRLYFDEIISLKALMHRPVHLYHHPNDGHPDLLNHLFHNLNSKHVRWMTYTDWAEWWQKRNSESFAPRYDPETRRVIQKSISHVPVAVHTTENFMLTQGSEIHIEESRFNPYINPELEDLINKRRRSPSMSPFKQLKDNLMTTLWRNRA